MHDRSRHNSPFFLRLALIGVIFVPIGMLIIGGALLWDQVKIDAWRDLEWRVGAAEDNISQSMEIDTLLLQRMQKIAALSDAEIAADQASVHDALADVALGLPRIHDLFITNAEGKILVSAKNYPVSDMNVGKDDYFRAAKTNSNSRLVVSDRLKVDQAMIFNVAQRRDGAQFRGIVGISMSLDYFESTFRETRLGGADGISISVLRENGNLLARVPPPRNYNLSSTVFQGLLGRGENDGRYETVSSYDNVRRMFSFSRVASYPIFVSVSASHNVLLNRWLTTLYPHLFFGFPATVLMVLLVVLAMQRTSAAMRAQHAAQAAQKMESIGRLAGGIAHDFNNSLAVIVGQAELALIHTERSENAFRSILKASGNASRLVTRLLTFSRSSPGAPVVLNINEEIERIATVLRPALGGGIITLQISLAPKSYFIEADPVELEMALLNLTMNARDAMPRGGSIMLNVTQSDNSVIINMTDNGAGMTPEVRERAFEPFFTTKEIGYGTGIGLPQVAAFAKNSKGSVAITSMVGQGTSVTLTLPCTNKRPSSQSAPIKAVENHKKMNVLLIEDDAKVAEVISLMLESMGCVTEWQVRGQAALERLRNGMRPDLVLSDIRMPGGMTGVDIAQEITINYPNIEVVLMTGYTEDLYNVQTLYGRVITKPVDRAALVEVVNGLRKENNSLAFLRDRKRLSST